MVSIADCVALREIPSRRDIWSSWLEHTHVVLIDGKEAWTSGNGIRPPFGYLRFLLFQDQRTPGFRGFILWRAFQNWIRWGTLFAGGAVSPEKKQVFRKPRRKDRERWTEAMSPTEEQVGRLPRPSLVNPTFSFSFLCWSETMPSWPSVPNIYATENLYCGRKVIIILRLYPFWKYVV